MLPEFLADETVETVAPPATVICSELIVRSTPGRLMLPSSVSWSEPKPPSTVSEPVGAAKLRLLLKPLLIQNRTLTSALLNSRFPCTFGSVCRMKLSPSTVPVTTVSLPPGDWTNPSRPV